MDERIKDLLLRFIDKTATADEREELLRLAGQSSNDQALLTALEQSWLRFNPTQTILRDSEQELILQKILGAPVVLIKRPVWKRWVAAASIVILLGAGLLWWSSNRTTQTDKPQIVDIPAPNKTRATITLADGRTISLDSLSSLTQDEVRLTKNSNGEIVYTGNSSGVVYNTLSNPRGSRVVSLTLSDGTRVWLNSESSLRYPIAFTGNNRQVEITGEAYFEVAKQAGKKFLVVTPSGLSTEVLGTQFNVNSYANEGSIKVTLLEGSVRVVKGDQAVTIRPGQQAEATTGLKVNDGVDIQLAVAWKNGLTAFKGADIKSIMRQVERWYDVDVVYEGTIPERKFSGGVSREAKLSELLRILEVSNIRFRMEGRRLVVMP